MSDLFSLQGSLYSAVRNTTTGKPGKRTWLGNASTATLAINVKMVGMYVNARIPPINVAKRFNTAMYVSRFHHDIRRGSFGGL